MKQVFWSAIVTGLLISGCTPVASVDGTPTSIRIMPLGDSITQADRNHNSYRRPLWLKLRAAGYDVNFVGSTKSHYLGNAPKSDFDQDHEGHWGWEVDEVLAQIDRWSEVAKPDVVLLHLGTNDILGGQSFDGTIAELRQLIETMRQRNPRLKILIAQLIPSSGGEALTQQFNQQVAVLARSINSQTSPVILVDQFSGFNVQQDTYDGLHPNESGEQKMASRWFQSLNKVLPKKP
ncbi:SGNH/GDSL hydrolase family protein [Leptolyngbya sp. FACHB-17]|uniref:SGNH/GDSL hydrolase family protein n=1 Tax=unclassified Leptolyngbya TaxID=2650499 RepID=UPI0016809519|nr:SGNH/GDSL hydrolase family protein [Leptolyngbya sp. FACHB-17]MBD2080592.1 cellulose-binding protein [Leptolyngbya sp. FACHB-17]